jgi:hypothetical protein
MDLGKNVKQKFSNHNPECFMPYDRIFSAGFCMKITMLPIIALLT